jgi:hypothetical protein
VACGQRARITPVTWSILRVAAFVVAGLAVLDPSLTASRRSRPLVSLVADDHARRELTADVERLLSRRFTVLAGVSDASSATVLVGATVPREVAAAGVPSFAVLPNETKPSAHITTLDAPTVAPLNSRIPVDVQLSVVGAAGRDVQVDLSIDGAVVSDSSAPVRSDSSIVTLQSAVMPEAGTHILHATARLTGATVLDSATTIVDVSSRRLPILVFDARPSWTSTFVRRALEPDARFTVTHRMLTSRGVSNTSGPAPASLRDIEALDDFATIIVGAPDQLAERDVAGLEAFMRRRGGRVVLLMDGRSSAPVDRLSGVQRWRVTQVAAPAAMVDAEGGGVLRGREFYWPAVTPTDATLHALNVARDSTRRPIIWSIPVGAGQLTMSGAVDAWHHRDDPSGFDAFWSSLVTGLSLAAPEPIDVMISSRLLAPGDEATVRVAIREPLLADGDIRLARVSAMILSPTDSAFVRLWPDRTPGLFSGRIVAPRDTGVYRLIVRSGTERADVPVVVRPTVRGAGEDQWSYVRAFVASRKGASIDESDMSRLPDLITAAVQPVSRVESWHPMRSPWWIVPFALLLGLEWWWRRRNGHA